MHQCPELTVEAPGGESGGLKRTLQCPLSCCRALAPASRQVAVAAQEPAVGATASQDVTPAAGFFTF